MPTTEPPTGLVRSEHERYAYLHPRTLTYASTHEPGDRFVAWSFTMDRPASDLHWERSLAGMSLADRALLRAACGHMLYALDRLDEQGDA